MTNLKIVIPKALSLYAVSRLRRKAAGDNTDPFSASAVDA